MNREKNQISKNSNKKSIKSLDILAQKLASLSKKEFETEVEANLKLQQIRSKLKYHFISQSLVTEKLVKKQKSKYQIRGSFKSDAAKIT